MPAYVHRSMLEMHPGADPRAPGGAVTAGLCGHWQHDGPCAVPHHSWIEEDGRSHVLRTVFVCADEDAAATHDRIESVLRRGVLADGPTGESRWTLISYRPDALTPDEAELGRRLIRTPRAR